MDDLFKANVEALARNEGGVKQCYVANRYGIKAYILICDEDNFHYDVCGGNCILQPCKRTGFFQVRLDGNGRQVSVQAIVT